MQFKNVDSSEINLDALTIGSEKFTFTQKQLTFVSDKNDKCFELLKTFHWYNISFNFF